MCCSQNTCRGWEMNGWSVGKKKKKDPVGHQQLRGLKPCDCFITVVRTTNELTGKYQIYAPFETSTICYPNSRFETTL